jgi:serine phosphatase RsbU (regulator of sigma subunit)
LILASTTLVVLIVVGFGGLQFMLIRRTFARTTATTEQRMREQMRNVGIAAVNAAGKSIQSYFEQTNDEDLRSYVTQLAVDSPDIAFVYVVDREGRLVAHSDARRSASGLAGWTDIAPRLGQNNEVVQITHAAPGEPTLALFARRITSAVQGQDFVHGHVVIGYRLSALQAVLAQLASEEATAVRQALGNAGMLGLAFGLLGTLLSVVNGLSVSRPIRTLARQAERIAGGDFESRVDIRSTTEVTTLARNFNYMAERIVASLEDARRRASLEKELDVARKIQFSLVPQIDSVQLEQVTLAAHFEPADKCGGDWWTWQRLDERRHLLVIADVTGHGIPSTMIAAAARASCSAALRQRQEPLCESIVQLMNSAIHDSAQGGLLMTSVVAVIDTGDMSATWINAGHTVPMVYRADSDAMDLLAAERLHDPLGLEPAVAMPAASAALGRGDLLVLYTDGITERTNAEGRMYGERRLWKLVERGGSTPAAALRDQIITDVRAWGGGGALGDDITLVVLRLGETGPAPGPAPSA